MTRLNEWAERVTIAVLEAATGRLRTVANEAAKAVLEGEVRAFVLELIGDPVMFSSREAGMAKQDARNWMDAGRPLPPPETAKPWPGDPADHSLPGHHIWSEAQKQFVPCPRCTSPETGGETP